MICLLVQDSEEQNYEHQGSKSFSGIPLSSEIVEEKQPLRLTPALKSVTSAAILFFFLGYLFCKCKTLAFLLKLPFSV